MRSSRRQGAPRRGDCSAGESLSRPHALLDPAPARALRTRRRGWRRLQERPSLAYAECAQRALPAVPWPWSAAAAHGESRPGGPGKWRPEGRGPGGVVGSEGGSASPGGLWTRGRGFRPRRRGAGGLGPAPGAAGAVGRQAGPRPRRPYLFPFAPRRHFPLFASGHRGLELFLFTSQSSFFSSACFCFFWTRERVSLPSWSCFEKVARFLNPGSQACHLWPSNLHSSEAQGGERKEAVSFPDRRSSDVGYLPETRGLPGQVKEDLTLAFPSSCPFKAVFSAVVTSHRPFNYFIILFFLSISSRPDCEL